jgi:hypothetical protein
VGPHHGLIGPHPTGPHPTAYAPRRGTPTAPQRHPLLDPTTPQRHTPFSQAELLTATGRTVKERRHTAWLADEGIGALAYSGKLSAQALTRVGPATRRTCHTQAAQPHSLTHDTHTTHTRLTPHASRLTTRTRARTRTRTRLTPHTAHAAHSSRLTPHASHAPCTPLTPLSACRCVSAAVPDGYLHPRERPTRRPRC